ncbi:MAG: hypothetical protein Q9188_003120 [Gyalolechia gomerana]
MIGRSRYLGLKGTKLNVMIGLIAGLDFFLFGYDQGVMGALLDLPSFVSSPRTASDSRFSLNELKVRTFPQIDIRPETEDRLGLSPSQRTHRSTIQGVFSELTQVRADEVNLTV